MASLSKDLSAIGRLDTSEKSLFRLDVDYFIGMDHKGHCLMFYEVYMTRNLENSKDVISRIQKEFDYENSTPLLKVNGMLHVDENILQPTFEKEISEALEDLFKALGRIQELVDPRNFKN